MSPHRHDGERVWCSEDHSQRQSLPPEGWSEPDDRGHVTYVRHGFVTGSAPEREGFEPYFVGVHGDDYTRWTYRPVVVAAPRVLSDRSLWTGHTGLDDHRTCSTPGHWRSNWGDPAAEPATLEEFLRELHVAPLNDDGLQTLVRLAVLRLAEHGHWRADESPVGASREIVWRAAQDISNQFGWFDRFDEAADREPGVAATEAERADAARIVVDGDPHDVFEWTPDKGYHA